jgi:YidC/Oxa1 family membrane protein insertase
MFTTLIVQPLFNLLVLIYALLPGHNFGLAIIIFTVVIRIMLWPLVKKQLHQTKAMRAMQPELKRIKKAAKGDRRKEQLMTMELYKERGINPFATFPILIVQFVVLIGLYYGLMRIIKDPQEIVSFAYPFIQDLGWLQQLAGNLKIFDNTLLGVVDLGRAAISSSGFYLPAFILVLGSAVAQYYQAKQLMPDEEDQRGLRAILKEASEGKQADQSEVNAAIGRTMRYMIPVFILVFTIGLPAALSLYWLVSGLVAFWQQDRILRQDESEMEAIADSPKKDVSKIPEAEVVKPKPKSSKQKKQAKKKRRKR